MARISSKSNSLSIRRPGIAATARLAAIAASIVGLGGSALALPAVQSTLVAKVPGYLQETILKGCPNGASTCYIDFTKVPANRQLVVTTVSCKAEMSLATTGILSFYLGKANASSNLPQQPHSFLKPTLTGTSTFSKNYHADGQILHLYGGGETPRVFVFPAGPGGARVNTLNCTIAGTFQAASAP